MNTDFTIQDAGIRRHPRGGYGQYQVYGTVNGQEITAHTTNSEAFDWFNDDSNPEKHEEAQEYVYSKLQRIYEESF